MLYSFCKDIIGISSFFKQTPVFVLSSCHKPKNHVLTRGAMDSWRWHNRFVS